MEDIRNIKVLSLILNKPECKTSREGKTVRRRRKRIKEKGAGCAVSGSWYSRYSMSGQKPFLPNSFEKSWEGFLLQVIIYFLRIPRGSQFTSPISMVSRIWLCHILLMEKCELRGWFFRLYHSILPSPHSTYDLVPWSSGVVGHWWCFQVSELKFLQGFLYFICRKICLYLLVVNRGGLHKTLW